MRPALSLSSFHRMVGRRHGRGQSEQAGGYLDDLHVGPLGYRRKVAEGFFRRAVQPPGEQALRLLDYCPVPL
jgi:hypothetical protein